MKKIIELVIVGLCLLGSCSCFFVYVDEGGKQCFYTNVFREERLLIQMETPVLQGKHKIILAVSLAGRTIIEQEVISKAKITVPRTTNVILDGATSSQMQYETCLSLKDITQQGQSSQSSQNNPQIQQNNRKFRNEGYMLNIKLQTSFDHKLENKVESLQEDNINYKQISSISEKLFSLNEEQINLHQIHEVKEKLTQNYLQGLKGKIIVFSMLQLLMIISFTFIQVRLLRGYLGDISII